MQDDFISRFLNGVKEEMNKTFDDVCDMLPEVCEQLRLSQCGKVGNPWVTVRFKQLCHAVNASYWICESGDGLYFCVCETEGNVKGLRI